MQKKLFPLILSLLIGLFLALLPSPSIDSQTNDTVYAATESCSITPNSSTCDPKIKECIAVPNGLGTATCEAEVEGGKITCVHTRSQFGTFYFPPEASASPNPPPRTADHFTNYSSFSCTWKKTVSSPSPSPKPSNSPDPSPSPSPSPSPCKALKQDFKNFQTWLDYLKAKKKAEKEDKPLPSPPPIQQLVEKTLQKHINSTSINDPNKLIEAQKKIKPQLDQKCKEENQQKCKELEEALHDLRIWSANITGDDPYTIKEMELNEATIKRWAGNNVNNEKNVSAGIQRIKDELRKNDCNFIDDVVEEEDEEEKKKEKEKEKKKREKKCSTIYSKVVHYENKASDLMVNGKGIPDDIISLINYFSAQMRSLNCSEFGYEPSDISLISRQEMRRRKAQECYQLATKQIKPDTMIHVIAKQKYTIIASNPENFAKKSSDINQLRNIANQLAKHHDEMIKIYSAGISKSYPFNYTLSYKITAGLLLKQGELFDKLDGIMKNHNDWRIVYLNIRHTYWYNLINLHADRLEKCSSEYTSL